MTMTTPGRLVEIRFAIAVDDFDAAFAAVMALPLAGAIEADLCDGPDGEA